MSKILRLIILCVIVAAALLAGAGCSSDDSSPVGQRTATDFVLKGLDGQPVSLSKQLGHPVLLNFWATWCGPCKSEMPYLQQIFEDKKWSDKGLVILGVSTNEPVERVATFMMENKLTFPVLLDTNGSVTQQYSIQYIPTTFFIDKNGIIKSTKTGAFADKQEIEKSLAQIAP